MLVAENKELKGRFQSFFHSMGFETVQYFHPLKALDNLSEISPRIIIVNSADYPRHWKIIVKQVRELRTREDTIIILTINKEFQTAEADKAAFLGVNVLFPNRLETVDDFRELHTRIERYIASPEQFQSLVWRPTEEEKVTFIFRHPDDYHMISGQFTEISPAGGIFKPDDPGDITGLEPGSIIESGSLKAGSSILSVRARIIHSSGSLMLSFLEFDNNGFEALMGEMDIYVETI